MGKAGKGLGIGTLVVLTLLLACTVVSAAPIRDTMPREQPLPYTPPMGFMGYVYDAAVGLPYMVFHLPVPAGLTLTGGAIGGPLGALALGFWGAVYHTSNEAEWDRARKYQELRDRGVPPDEAYELANKNEIHAACLSVLIGVLGSLPAQILRFALKKRYSLIRSAFWAFLISCLSLIVQTPFLYPPYGTGTTFILSMVVLLRPKLTSSKPHLGKTNAISESFLNEDSHKKHQEKEREGQKSSNRGTESKASFDSFDNAGLQENIILYIVSHSTSQRLSKSKLRGYLALLSRRFNLGLEVTLGEYGVQIEGFQNLLDRIRDAGLISIHRVKTVSGGYRYIYRAKAKVQGTSIPHELRASIDKMIEEWDTKRSKTLLDTIANELAQIKPRST